MRGLGFREEYRETKALRGFFQGIVRFLIEFYVRFLIEFYTGLAIVGNPSQTRYHYTYTTTISPETRLCLFSYLFSPSALHVHEELQYEAPPNWVLLKGFYLSYHNGGL